MCKERYTGFPGGKSGKELACWCRRHKRCQFDPWVGKIPWRRAWQPTPVFLPGETHGQRGLAGYLLVQRVSKSQMWLKWLTTHACKEWYTSQLNNSKWWDHQTSDELLLHFCFELRGPLQIWNRVMGKICKSWEDWHWERNIFSGDWGGKAGGETQLHSGRHWS